MTLSPSFLAPELACARGAHGPGDGGPLSPLSLLRQNLPPPLCSSHSWPRPPGSENRASTPSNTAAPFNK